MIRSIAIMLLGSLLAKPVQDPSAAEKAFKEAEELTRQQTADANRQAVEKFEQALTLYRAAGDRKGQAATLITLGEAYRNVADLPNAMDRLNRGLPMARELGERAGEMKALQLLGLISNSRGERRKAIEYFEEQLKLARETDDRSMQANSLVNIGSTLAALSDLDKALEALNEAEPVIRETSDRPLASTRYRILGDIYAQFGDRRKALEYYSQALEAARSAGDKGREALNLTFAGQMHSLLGEKQKALELLTESAALNRIVGSRNNEAVALDYIGQLYSSLGDREKALDYYNQALSLARAAGNRITEATILGDIANTLARNGQQDKALELGNQSLAIVQAAGDRQRQANRLNNRGWIYDSVGEFREALDSYAQSLDLYKAIGDRSGQSYALTNVGRVYYALGEYKKALEYYDQALPLRRGAGDRSGEALTLYNAARAHVRLGELTQAAGRVTEAISIAESIRTSVASFDARATYFATVEDYYKLYIDVLMSMHALDASAGHAEAALEISERARGRSLTDLLLETNVDIREGVDKELVAREQSLRQKLNENTETLLRLKYSRRSETQTQAAEKDVARLTTELDQVRSQIRQRSPQYAGLMQPQALKAAEIQQLLDDDTLLLEYALGEERSYVWAVSLDGIRSFELPKRADIEQASRDLYKLLETEAPAAKFENAAAKLSRMLVFPLNDVLRKQRLVIVPDGALAYVPFSGLRKSESRALVGDHEIVTLPSASTLSVLRRQTAGRKPARGSVAVIADPVFRADDVRVKSAGVSVATKEDARFPRLIGSRREAFAILGLAPQRDRKQALDFDASIATAQRAELGNYRMIHFATHGVLDTVQPELSGLVLSLVNEKGERQNGFLGLADIYNLKLPADMIVLSACQTALGREIKGEGLIGLARGFMYAGAPRVVASLWKVDDRATSELMKNFYEGMLGPRRLRPAAALRAAQVALSRQKQWQSPYYWAGFVLEGEWR